MTGILLKVLMILQKLKFPEAVSQHIILFVLLNILQPDTPFEERLQQKTCFN
jgi:hypothetical protein